MKKSLENGNTDSYIAHNETVTPLNIATPNIGLKEKFDTLKIKFIDDFESIKESFSETATRGVLCKKSVLRKFIKFTGKHLCQSLFFNRVAGLRPATLLKKRLWHRCFPVNFEIFLRTPFSQNISGQLLLHFYQK